MSRAQVIWISQGGTGRVRKASFSPYVLGGLIAVVVMCIITLPFLEKRLLSLQGTVTDLEQETNALRAEIMTLLYVRNALAHMDEREKILRSHFGIEKYESLEQVMGLGGESPSQAWSSSPEGSGCQREPHVGFSALADENPHRRMAHRAKTLTALHQVLGRLKGRQAEMWENTPSIAPLDSEKSTVSSGFGLRTNPFTNKVEFHAGVDFSGAKGTKIIAPAHGEVIEKGYDQWLGNHVVLQHSNEIKTLYGHLDTISVNKGDQLRRGSRIGSMGNTGLSTSPHLHYAVIVGGRAVDPLQFVLDMRAGK